MDYSIDFFLNILRRSLFHPSFASLFLAFIFVQGIPVNSYLFIWSSVYTGSVFFVWFLGYMTKVSRNGRKSRKIDWDDEIVLITGGSKLFIIACQRARVNSLRRLN